MLRPTPILTLAFVALLLALPGAARADRLRLANGQSIEVDEVWEDSQGVWFRRGNVTERLDRSRVSSIEWGERPGEQPAVPARTNQAPRAAASAGGAAREVAPQTGAAQPVWINLVGGAKVIADEAQETAQGVWYRRDKLFVFVAKARVASVERERPAAAGEIADSVQRNGWSTGRPDLDALIRQSGERYGVDPYLIFCVMEQESHFNPRAVSRAGARGLMQLMPGTARRFGVSRPHDPAQSIAGGTRYLKELIGMFDGRVDLVLASYNAGEGAVARYGQRVPPYAETRNYVRRIGARYGKKSVAGKAKAAAPAAGVED